ncbi:hypothetical protein ACJMK2_036605 [Sinanodonta woodiana]|uniref:Cleavage and polyadenylation specificity factor subunit 2 n=1 Tax=Sinanodonta woodiana TaxID=1069815 RepID=A0ABD3WIX7_SINWO
MKLEGAELEEFLKKKQEKEEEQRNKADMAENLESESSDESEEEMEIDGMSYPISSKAKHDLMMKNEGKSRTGFFKQAKKSYPMFPFTEERIRWDEYGEIIKPEDYIILDTTPMDEEMATEKRAISDESMQDLSEVPTKCISVTVTLDMNANIQYIDFEGRTDGESMKKILSQIKPRQLVLVHGSAEATYALADYCRSTPGLVQGKVFTPSLGEIVDATTESHIYQVKLKDYLVSALDFAKARDAELAWIDGKLDMVEAKIDTSPKYEPEEGEIAEEDKENEEKETSIHNDSSDVALDIIPSLEALSSHLVMGHRAVFVNEPKLSDFKSVLLGQNIQAEFGAGSLICNDKVAVKRNEAGRIQLEGMISEDYFAIRELLYEQYAIV